MKKCLAVALAFLVPSLALAQCSNGSCGVSSGRGRTVIRSNGSWSAPQMMPQLQMMAPQSPPTTAVSSLSIDQLINAERERVGLPPVKVSESFSNELWTAVSPLADQALPAQKLKTVKAKHIVSEGHASPADTVRDWMANAQTRALILSEHYNTCGYHSVLGSNGRVYRVLGMK